MAASIAALIDSLPNSDNKIKILDDLKTLLGNLTVQTISSVVANVSFNCVFSCLMTDNREELELCCDVLTKLLSPVPAAEILTQFEEELQTGLTHKDPSVRKLCLSQISRVATDAISELVLFERVVQQVVRTVADEVLDVAKCAMGILAICGTTAEGLQMLYHGNVMAEWQEAMSLNDTVRFRFYEVVVSICVQSVEGLQRSAESGLLQQFINEVYRDDILLQLNCLEMLSDLALCEHGLLYLDGQGVIAKLETMMQAAAADPLAAFLIPGLVKFFGCVARLHPKEMCTGNATFITTVLNNLQSPESPAMHHLVIQTVGMIGSSVEGKLALEKLGTRIDTGVKCMGKAFRDTQQETKIVILQSLHSLLNLKVPDQTTELLKLTEYWYSHLGTRTLDYLMRLVEQPFPELHVATLSLLQVLAAQPWSQVLLNNFPAFKEFLLDRSTEQTKEGKEKKFELIQTLANSPTASEIFGTPYMVLLKAYCTQGPFYVRAQAEVAMEGD